MKKNEKHYTITERSYMIHSFLAEEMIKCAKWCHGVLCKSVEGKMNSLQWAKFSGPAA